MISTKEYSTIKYHIIFGLFLGHVQLSMSRHKITNRRLEAREGSSIALGNIIVIKTLTNQSILVLFKHVGDGPSYIVRFGVEICGDEFF